MPKSRVSMQCTVYKQTLILSFVSRLQTLNCTRHLAHSMLRQLELSSSVQTIVLHQKQKHQRYDKFFRYLLQSMYLICFTIYQFSKKSTCTAFCPSCTFINFGKFPRKPARFYSNLHIYQFLENVQPARLFYLYDYQIE